MSLQRVTITRIDVPDVGTVCAVEIVKEGMEPTLFTDQDQREDLDTETFDLSPEARQLLDELLVEIGA